MPTTILRANIKPDYTTDPFSLVLTENGEAERRIQESTFKQHKTTQSKVILVYHAFEASDVLENLEWLGTMHTWDKIIISFSGSSEDLTEIRNKCQVDELIPVANRGRNILPLLNICSELLDLEDIVLHLHGKKSVPEWRRQIEAQLIKSPNSKSIHLNWFENKSNGVIAPTTFDGVRQHATWEGNFAIARDIFARAYPDLPRLSPYNLLSFPAGGMFWFRARVLKKIAEVVAYEDFSPEPMPPDRSVAHAIERLIFHCCEAEGLQWGFAFDEQTNLCRLQPPKAILSDWRNHYIELLLQMLHQVESEKSTIIIRNEIDEKPMTTYNLLKTIIKRLIKRY